HGFHVLVTPDARGPDFEHHVPEESAGDYPEGRYEYALQHAAEDNDQGELDALFGRRSRRQTMKMAAALLVLFAALALVMRTPIEPAAPPQRAKPQEEKQDGKGPALPPPEKFHALDAQERRAMAACLGELAGRLGVELPPGDSEDTLREAV